MTTTNLVSEVERMVAGAIDRFKLGMDINYVFSFGWGPLPNGQGLTLAYWILMSTPSPLLGQEPLQQLRCIPVVSPNQKLVDEAVMNTLGDLRTDKAKAMSFQNGKDHKSG